MIIAVIPARGGSKGLPGKNIRLLSGVPLIAHSILSAKESNLIDRIIVSTDDFLISEIAISLGVEVMIRPKNLATDLSTDYDLFGYLVDDLKLSSDDIIVQLRPTSPIRENNIIDTCIETLLLDQYATSIRTVSIPDHTPFKMFYKTDPYITPLFENVGNVREPYNAPRQSLPPVVEPNGCVDVFYVGTIRDHRSVTGDKILPVLMDTSSTVDIDALRDIENAEKMLQRSERKIVDMSEVKLGRIPVGKNYPCFFIAEAGINHNGSLEKAKSLIDIAHESGAQCVKFQKRDIDSLFTEAARNRVYNSANAFGVTYGQHKEFLEFTEEQFVELKAYADKVGIMFTASPWDHKSVDVLERVGVPFYKVASADLTNWPLLEYILNKGKPVILSTGMASMSTVWDIVEKAKKINPNLVILQCTSTYPPPPQDINLDVIRTYQNEFPDVVVGYSGHEKGLAISLAAVVIGASVIERHLTEDRTQKGGDHAASLEPDGFKRLVRDVRVVELARGDGIKRVMPGEDSILLKLGKSICSISAIPSGTKITKEMLCCKSDIVCGMSPMRIEDIVGKTAVCDISADTAIQSIYIS